MTSTFYDLGIDKHLHLYTHTVTENCKFIMPEVLSRMAIKRRCVLRIGLHLERIRIRIIS